MPKYQNQKLRLFTLYRIFCELTDENHKLSLMDLSNELAKYGFKADRKTLYTDLDDLLAFNIAITRDGNRRGAKYYLEARDFEPVDVQMLSDALRSSKFLTAHKTNELIQKLNKQLSIYQRKNLYSHLYVNQLKTDSKSVVYHLDAINNALNKKLKISFVYTKWDINKNLVPKNNSQEYFVSPISLVWDKGYYYLIAYSDKDQEIRHYRVDKMKSVNVTNDSVDESNYEGFDVSKHVSQSFNMYSGETKLVHLRCKRDILSVIIDRFGKKINLYNVDDDYFEIKVEVALSKEFFAFIFSLGTQIEILAPSECIEQYQNTLKDIIGLYK